MEATDKPFGDALRELMAERDIGVRELSRKTGGISSGGSTISHYTRGYLNPSVEQMERLARALDVNPKHFAEYRLELVRSAIDWHGSTQASLADRRRLLAAALAKARELGLDV